MNECRVSYELASWRLSYSQYCEQPSQSWFIHANSRWHFPHARYAGGLSQKNIVDLLLEVEANESRMEPLIESLNDARLSRCEESDLREGSADDIEMRSLWLLLREWVRLWLSHWVWSAQLDLGEVSTSFDGTYVSVVDVVSADDVEDMIEDDEDEDEDEDAIDARDILLLRRILIGLLDDCLKWRWQTMTVARCLLDWWKFDIFAFVDMAIERRYWIQARLFLWSMRWRVRDKDEALRFCFAMDKEDSFYAEADMNWRLSLTWMELNEFVVLNETNGEKDPRWRRRQPSYIC